MENLILNTGNDKIYDSQIVATLTISNLRIGNNKKLLSFKS